MDFMKWLNSLDELLYEVMSWLLFFPLTLWQAISQPLATMQAVGQQDALPDDQQYVRLLSPPLFLTLGLLLAHGLATALGQTDAIVANRHGLAGLVDDATTALLLRVIVFASFPLFLAARFVRRSGKQLDRKTLKQPFYEQCFPGAIFALGVSVATSLLLSGEAWGRVVGLGLLPATVLYFLSVETRWFSLHAGGKPAWAFASVAVALLQGALFVIVVGFVFTR
jgi:hypothetical protein